MTTDEYLAIICVALPLVTLAILAAVVIIMKLGWIKQEGEG